MLSERLEVRIDEQTMDWVRREAERRGISVGELVRGAIERLRDDDRQARMAAAEALCSMEIDIAPWEDMDEDYKAAYFAKLP